MSGSSTPYLLGRRPLERKDLLTAGQVGELPRLRQGTIEDYARRDLLPSFKDRHASPVRSRADRGSARRAD